MVGALLGAAPKPGIADAADEAEPGIAPGLELLVDAVEFSESNPADVELLLVVPNGLLVGAELAGAAGEAEVDAVPA